MKSMYIVFIAVFSVVFAAGIGIAAQSHPWSEVGVNPSLVPQILTRDLDIRGGIHYKDTSGVTVADLWGTRDGTTPAFQILTNKFVLRSLTSDYVDVFLNNVYLKFYTHSGTYLGEIWARENSGKKVLEIDNFDVVYSDGRFEGEFSNKQHAKLWGEGRIGVEVIDSGGECIAPPSSSIRVSRGNVAVTWDNAAAGCPAGWWVCSAEEFHYPCGDAHLPFLDCQGDEAGTTREGWLVDRADGVRGKTGWAYGIASTYLDAARTCFGYAAWCCQYV